MTRKDTTNSHYLRKIIELSVPDKNGCWVWQGLKSNNGYGRMNFHGKVRNPHRIIMRLLNRIKDEKLYVDHTCRNSSCVNPDHLRMVTPQINSIENNDGFANKNANKTHCPEGHEYTKENTYTFRSMGRRRICKICRNKKTVINRRKNLQSTV